MTQVAMTQEEIIVKLQEYLASGNAILSQCHVSWGGFDEATNQLVLYMDVVAENLNSNGFLHGGAYFTVADTAAGFLAHISGDPHVTLDAKMDFLRSATGGRLTCVAVPLKTGRSIKLIETRITDEEGHLLYHAVFNMMRVSRAYE